MGPLADEAYQAKRNLWNAIVTGAPVNDTCRLAQLALDKAAAAAIETLVLDGGANVENPPLIHSHKPTTPPTL